MKSDSNKTFSELMQSNCVMVNGGSGVLVDAMTQDYSYVLTAAHTIDEKVAGNIVTDHKGNKLEVLGVLLAPKVGDAKPLDSAILKVNHQPHVAQRYFKASSLSQQANLTLVGFPGTERKSSDPIKHWDGHSSSVVDELIVFTIDGIPGKDIIQGMSGGGVYHIADGYPYLVGVEFRMDATHQDQQHGRVQCLSLVRFDEIIAVHASAPMVPAHLECFSRMSEMIFAFNVIDQANVHHLKLELCRFADLLIASGMPPPYEIMKQYDLQLLVDATRPGDLKSRELWVAYLEFLVICALMDNVGVADANYIKRIERKRRLLYTSDGANWISRLEELLKSARKMLDKEGTVIVASPDAASSLLPPGFLLERVINNIAVVPSGGPFSIDEVESSIYTSFKLTHLEGLRKSCVVDREFEYHDVPPGVEQLRLLRNKLDEIIK